MKVSVVIPLYNKSSTIARTLATVAAQTYSDYEVVVVDDGSTDGSADIVRRINDPRLRIICQPNGGVSAARNRGIDEARGEFIAFLDADDEWKPDYLETQVALTEKYPGCDVFCTDYEFRDSQGKVTPTIIRRLPFTTDDGILSNYFEVASHSHPPVCSISIMVRKSAIQSVGCFPVGIKSGEDLLTWARLAVSHQIAYSRKTLAVFVFDYVLFNEDQRKRSPEEEDIVGRKLIQLYRQNKSTIGLKSYVGLWHKMRARIYIQKKQRWKALTECAKSLHYSCNKKVLAFFVLSLLPYSFSNYLFRKWG